MQRRLSSRGFNATAPSARKAVSLQSSCFGLPVVRRTRNLRCPCGRDEVESHDINRAPSSEAVDIDRRAIVSAGFLVLASCTSPSEVGLPLAAAKEFSIQGAIDAAEPGDVIQIPGAPSCPSAIIEY